MADRCEDPFSADYVTKERLFCPTQSGTGLAEGESRQVEPDSPALADWLLDAYNNSFWKSCHPVMLLYGISLLLDSRPQTPDPS